MTDPEAINVDYLFLPLEVAECVVTDWGLGQAEVSTGHVRYWEEQRPWSAGFVLPLHDGTVNAAALIDALESRGVTWEEATESMARCSIGADIRLTSAAPRDPDIPPATSR